MSTPPPEQSPFKENRGLARAVKALHYSRLGLSSAWAHEEAFRQELWLVVPLLVLALLLPLSGLEKVALIAPLFLLLIVELLNSGLEAVVDRISLEHHPLAGRAKDMGSAAVLLALVLIAVVWLLVLWPHLWLWFGR